MSTDLFQNLSQSSSSLPSSVQVDGQSLHALLNSNAHLSAAICDILARDPRIRQPYLAALSRSLSSRDEFASLVDLITMLDDRGELPVVMALVEVVHTDQLQDLARLLTHLFDAKNLLSQLVINVLLREMSLSPNETVLRSSSLVSSILSYSFQTFGSHFVAETIGPIARRLIDFDDATCYEVHPEWLKRGANVEENRKNLRRLTFEVLNALTSPSIRPRFPPKLRSLCRCVHQVLPERVGILIFLRFINPFLTSLSEFCVVTERTPPENVQRAFTLVAKLLQSAANGQPLKEESMKPMNETVVLLRKDINEFVCYLIEGELKI